MAKLQQKALICSLHSAFQLRSVVEAKDQCVGLNTTVESLTEDDRTNLFLQSGLRVVITLELQDGE